MLILFAFLACDPGARATDLCRDRREALDALYTRYGGSELAEGAQGGPIGNAIQGADRASFEDKCLELGRGGRPTFLGDKAKKFFAEEENVISCGLIVNIEDKVKTINRELPADAQVTCP